MISGKYGWSLEISKSCYRPVVQQIGTRAMIDYFLERFARTGIWNICVDGKVNYVHIREWLRERLPDLQRACRP